MDQDLYNSNVLNDLVFIQLNIKDFILVVCNYKNLIMCMTLVIDENGLPSIEWNAIFSQLMATMVQKLKEYLKECLPMSKISKDKCKASTELMTTNYSKLVL